MDEVAPAYRTNLAIAEEPSGGDGSDAFADGFSVVAGRPKQMFSSPVAGEENARDWLGLGGGERGEERGQLLGCGNGIA